MCLRKIVQYSPDLGMFEILDQPRSRWMPCSTARPRLRLPSTPSTRECWPCWCALLVSSSRRRHSSRRSRRLRATLGPLYIEDYPLFYGDYYYFWREWAAGKGMHGGRLLSMPHKVRAQCISQRGTDASMPTPFHTGCGGASLRGPPSALNPSDGPLPGTFMGGTGSI